MVCPFSIYSDVQHVVPKNIFLYRITGRIQPNVGEGNSSLYKLMVTLDLFQREIIAKIHENIIKIFSTCKEHPWVAINMVKGIQGF